MPPAPRRVVLLLAAAALYVVGATTAPRPARAQGDAREAVRLDGREVIRLGPAGEEDAATRARRVEARLEAVLRAEAEAGLTRGAAPRARAEPREGGEWRVMVGPSPVATVAAEDAEDAGAEPPALAAAWARAVDEALDRARERRAGWTGRVGAETRGALENALARMAESASRVVPRALSALVVVAAFWGTARLIRAGLRALFARAIRTDATTESLVKQFTYYGVLALGLIVAADALGFSPETVVTGLGLTGLALGFALRDIISNFVSGLLILALRPFEIGDQIEVGATEGTVERIELRATLIRTYDGRVALVPNAEIFAARMVNNTADPVRRGRVSVPVGYGTDLRRLADALRASVAIAPGVLPERPVVVRVSDLGAAEVTLDLLFWTDSRRSDHAAAAAAVRLVALDALAAESALPNPDLRLLRPEDAAAWRAALGASS